MLTVIFSPVLCAKRLRRKLYFHIADAADILEKCSRPTVNLGSEIQHQWWCKIVNLAFECLLLDVRFNDARDVFTQLRTYLLLSIRSCTKLGFCRKTVVKLHSTSCLIESTLTFGRNYTEKVTLLSDDLVNIFADCTYYFSIEWKFHL